ncbi:MAG: hypothetical protein ACW99G_17330 [Candidatus Thorarchaeota archaeon]|jgi:hypothetical protein
MDRKKDYVEMGSFHWVRKTEFVDPLEALMKSAGVLTERPDVLPDELEAYVYVQDGQILWVEGAKVFMKGDSSKATVPTMFSGCEIFTEEE